MFMKEYNPVYPYYYYRTPSVPESMANVPIEQMPDVSNILNTNNVGKMKRLYPDSKRMDAKEVDKIYQRAQLQIQDSIASIDSLTKEIQALGKLTSNSHVKQE